MPTKASATERVMRRIDTSADGCWLWPGYRNSSGYGLVRAGTADEGYLMVHRVVYEALRGPIPEGLQLDHLCRVRLCCNPAHLEPVTNRENVHRGLSGVAREQCANGHDYTPENVMIQSGVRRCRICRAEQLERAARKYRSTPEFRAADARRHREARRKKGAHDGLGTSS